MKKECSVLAIVFLIGLILVLSISFISAASCTDSDATAQYPRGINYFAKGNIVTDTGTFADVCEANGKIREYYCPTQNISASMSVNCANLKAGYVCSDGVCVNSSTIIPADPCANVNCNDNNACTDDSCSNGNCVNTAKTCPSGQSCNNGVCTFSVEIDRCSDLNNDVKSKIIELQKSGKNITLREGDITYRRDYLVVNSPYPDGKVLRVYTIYNSSYSYYNDKVTFQDVIGLENYETIITSEGSGTVTIGGIVYSVNYYANDPNRDKWYVTLSWAPLNEVCTFTNCQIIDTQCTDSDGGKNKYVKGKMCLGNECKEDACKLGDNKENYVIEQYCYNENNPSDMYMHCPNGCSDGACIEIVPGQNEVCQNLIDLIANPEDISIYDQTYQANDWNYNYSSWMWINNQEEKYNEYSASWSSYDNDKNSYVNTRLMIFDNKNIDLNNWIKERTNYPVCKINTYWNYDTSKENIIYICNWDILNNKQDLNNYQYKSRGIFWANNNVVVQIYVSSGRSLTDDEVNKIALKRVNDLLNDLKNNEGKYIDYDNFDVSYLARNFIDLSLKYCGSDLKEPVIEGTNQTCSPSWQCKIEPVICPEYGYQKKTCIDYWCNQEKREEQIYCSPGLCSGCYKPRYYSLESRNTDNICIPYGTRFVFKKGESLKIPEWEINREGYFNLTILNENEGVISLVQSIPITLVVNGQTFNGEIGESMNFYEGTSYDVDYKIKDGSRYEENKITALVKDVHYSENPDERYVEIRMGENDFNAYCNYDGNIYEQKMVDSQGNWATCQNNYECESNLCSSGECVEITKMIQEVKGFKSTFVKIFCKLAHLFSIENYEQCVSSRL
ncbi:MAG: hypothetical protein AABX54_02330 [Nanoarchaeota archaeon]